MPTVSLSTQRRYDRMVWPRLVGLEVDWAQTPGAFRCIACGYPGALHAIGDGYYQVSHPSRRMVYQGDVVPIVCRVPADDPNVEAAMSHLADTQNDADARALVDGMRR
jgi:hypothetical protein